MDNLEKLSIDIYSAGIDALSFTMLKNSEPADLIRKMVLSGIQDDRAAGNDWKTTTRHGYDGVMSKHCFVGEYKTHNFVEVKGCYADEITREVINIGAPIKATRIDAYVDYKGEAEAATYYKRLRERVETEAARMFGSAPSKGSSHSCPDGSWSVYIATGNKDVVGRSYNKALESNDTARPLRRRHELQVRHARARKLFPVIASAASNQWIARSLLVAHLMRYNIDEPWMQDTQPCSLPSRYERSDREKRLAWFHGTACLVAKRLLSEGCTFEEVFHPLMSGDLAKCIKSLNSALMFSAKPQNLHLQDTDEWVKHGNLSLPGAQAEEPQKRVGLT